MISKLDNIYYVELESKIYKKLNLEDASVSPEEIEPQALMRDIQKSIQYNAQSPLNFNWLKKIKTLQEKHPLLNKIEHVYKLFYQALVWEGLKQESREKEQIPLDIQERYETFVLNDNQNLIIDPASQSHLLLYCLRSHSSYVRSLAHLCLKQNANCLFEDKDGCSPILYACARGEGALIRELYIKGGDPFKSVKSPKSGRYSTPIDQACQHPEAWTLLRELLLAGLLQDSKRDPNHLVFYILRIWILKHQASSSFPIQEIKDLWILIEKSLESKPACERSLLDAFKNLFTKIDEYRQLAYNEEDTLALRLDLEAEIRDLIKFFKEQGVENVEILMNTLNSPFKRSAARVSAAKQWMKDLERIPFNLDSHEDSLNMWGISQENQKAKDALSLCMKDKNYDLLFKIVAELYKNDLDHDMRINRPKTHFLLDKVWPDIEWNGVDMPFIGGKIFHQALILGESLQNILVDMSYEENLLEEDLAIKELFTQLLKSLAFCIKWHKDPNPQEIVTLLKDPQVDFPLLIPYGYIKHSMLICLEKTPEGVIKTLYNTGGGVLRYHPQWKSTNKYQTYLSVTHIPLEDLCSHEMWEELIGASKTETTPKKAYELFFTLGQRHALQEASQYSDDYEQKQMHGTCSGQVFMAMMRHQILKKIQGPYANKRGVYEYYKSLWTYDIGNYELDRVDPKIKGYLEVKLQKVSALQAFEGILKAASSEYLQEFKDVFVEGVIDLATLKQRDPRLFYQQFYGLRRLALQIAQVEKEIKGDEILFNTKSHPILVYAELVVREKRHAQQQILAWMNKLEKDQCLHDLVDLFMRIVFSSKYGDLAVRWLKEKTLEENVDANFIETFFKILVKKSPLKPKSRVLLDCLKSMFGERKDLVKALKMALEKSKG